MEDNEFETCPELTGPPEKMEFGGGGNGLALAILLIGIALIILSVFKI